MRGTREGEGAVGWEVVEDRLGWNCTVLIWRILRYAYAQQPRKPNSLDPFTESGILKFLLNAP